MAWLELVPGEAINTDETWRVAISGNSVDYFSPALAAKYSINYGSPEAAQDAYDAWLEAVTPTPPPLVPGDRVKLRGTGTFNWRENDYYTVEHVPNVALPWWVILGNNTQTRFIFAIGNERVMEKIE